MDPPSHTGLNDTLYNINVSIAIDLYSLVVNVDDKKQKDNPERRHVPHSIKTLGAQCSAHSRVFNYSTSVRRYLPVPTCTISLASSDDLPSGSALLLPGIRARVRFNSACAFSQRVGGLPCH